MNERVIIWGTGDYYSRYREDILQMNVIALVDSDRKKQGKIIDEIQVISPEEVQDKEYDKIYIMSTAIDVIRQRMIEIGIAEQKIRYFFDLEQRRGIPVHSFESSNLSKKKAAIISHEFTVTGAPNCLLQLTKYLLRNDWHVKIGSPYDGKIKEEFQEIGAECFVDERLMMGTLDSIEWINGSDIIIVNTVSIYYLLRKRNVSIPLIWWLHEPLIFYRSVVPEIINSLPTENMNVYTVSNVADEAFHEVCKSLKTEQLMFGVEDSKKTVKKIAHEGVRFIIIGQISKIKGQDILVDAIRLLTEEERKRCEFLLVGNNDSAFAKGILNDLECIGARYISTGAISHEETMYELSMSDVLICASRVETVSMAVVEAMMLEVPAIVSDKAGVVEYIEDGVSGLVFESENAESLYECIQFALKNTEQSFAIGRKGRQIFRDIFETSAFIKSMDKIMTKELFCNKLI